MVARIYITQNFTVDLQKLTFLYCSKISLTCKNSSMQRYFDSKSCALMPARDRMMVNSAVFYLLIYKRVHELLSWISLSWSIRGSQLIFNRWGS